MDVAIIILNYRTPELTIQCLESLEGQIARSGNRVIVVEGGSGDDSRCRISEAIEQHGWDRWASLMALPENRGYAAGNNAAIREVLSWDEPPRYVLILNSDIVAREGAVDALVRFMDAHPAAGIAASQLEDPDGTPQHGAFRFLSVWSELERGMRLGPVTRLLRRKCVPMPVRERPHRADWVAGASFMIRRDAIREIGLMDEGYFLYYDEVDYCLRAARAGWERWQVPTSRMVHLVGQSTGVSRKDEHRVKRLPPYWYESRRRFFVKAYGVAGLALADVMWALGRTSLLLRRALRLGGDTRGDPRWFLWDLLWGDLKAIVSGQAFRIRGSEQIR